MNAPENMTAIIEGKRYSTKSAKLLAGDDYWDGHNYERSGTNTFLYKTPRGAYFFVHLTQWMGQQNNILPCSVNEAIEFYENQNNRHIVGYEDAFPDITIEDA